MKAQTPGGKYPHVCRALSGTYEDSGGGEGEGLVSGTIPTADLIKSVYFTLYTRFALIYTVKLERDRERESTSSSRIRHVSAGDPSAVCK